MILNIFYLFIIILTPNGFFFSQWSCFILIAATELPVQMSAVIYGQNYWLDKTLCGYSFISNTYPEDLFYNLLHVLFSYLKKSIIHIILYTFIYRWVKISIESAVVMAEDNSMFSYNSRLLSTTHI